MFSNELELNPNITLLNLKFLLNHALIIKLIQKISILIIVLLIFIELNVFNNNKYNKAGNY